jgi:phospholipid/cholesterol/gamma-HCH transport system substrate-binding protein
VGYVESVDIRPDGMLVVKFRIRKRYKVPEGTTATIEPNGFFGDQLIALKPAKPSPKTYLPNDTLASGRPTPQIGDVLARVDTIAGHISVLASALRKELVETGGFGELRKTVRSANELMQELSKVAEEQNAELTRTQASLRRMASVVDSAQIDSTVKAYRSAATNAQALATDLRTTTARLNTTLDKIDHGEGTAAKLMNDPAMYNDVRSLVTRLDSLTADFKKNPRKYIKLSIF